MQKNGQSARELLQILSEAPHTLGDEQSVHTLLAQSTSALNAESYEAYLALGSLFTPQTTPELLALLCGATQITPPNAPCTHWLNMA